MNIDHHGIYLQFSNTLASVLVERFHFFLSLKKKPIHFPFQKKKKKTKVVKMQIN